MATINGNNSNNNLPGTELADRIRGLGGDDRLIGKGGNDEIFGGLGADTIDGDRGDDRLLGDSEGTVFGGGDGVITNANTPSAPDFEERMNPLFSDLDEPFGSLFTDTPNDDLLGDSEGTVFDSGDDTSSKTPSASEFDERVNPKVPALDEPFGPLFTNTPNDDLIRGGIGNDTILGELGFDTLIGDSGSDRIRGGSGNDSLLGGDDDDNLSGDSGEDTVFGNRGDDNISGVSGNDVLSGDAGDDILNGGSGNDRLDGGNDNDNLEGGLNNDTLKGGFGNDSLSGGGGADNLEGGLDDDTLTGGGNNDTIDGGNGVDLLDGDSGNDVLKGGQDNDTLFGDAGNDTLFGSTENEQFGSFESNELDGSTGKDSLIGSSGEDILVGGEDKDTLIGGADNDLLIGGINEGAGFDDKSDIFKFTGDEFGGSFGNDIIRGFQPGVDKIELGFDIILSRNFDPKNPNQDLALKNFELLDFQGGNILAADGMLDSLDGPFVTKFNNDTILNLPESGQLFSVNNELLGTIEYQRNGQPINFDGGTILIESSFDSAPLMENDFIFFS